MRHGVAFRKLSRTSAHRDLMLRNMVSSLLEHEQIKTTLAKAKEASRIAEWVITWGKKGTEPDRRRAQGFLMNPTKTMPKLFQELAARYANRPGGYTRIHLFGNRKGDHAPAAILELVDNPNDIRFATTAKSMGRELARIVRFDKRNEKAVLEWATLSPAGPSSISAGQSAAIVNLLSGRTKSSVLKALKYAEEASADAAESSSASSVDVIPEASTSTSTSSTTARSPTISIQAFHVRARETFLQTTAMSEIPTWQPDMGRYEALLDESGNERSKVPVTVPGHGRKVWAGQEDLAQRFERTSLKSQQEQEWEDEAAATTASTLEQQRQERLANLQKKMRHPDGRNGAYGQRSAISRSKGHQAAPRGGAERKQYLDMPRLSAH